MEKNTTRKDALKLTDEQLASLGISRKEFEAMADDDIAAASRCWFSCTESCTKGACETTCTAGGGKK